MQKDTSAQKECTDFITPAKTQGIQVALCLCGFFPLYKMAGIITIKLNQLRFFAFHGLYAEEQQTGNGFEVNIILSYPAPEAVIEEITGTINYAEVYALVKKRMSHPTALLETLAMEMAASIHTAFPQISVAEIAIKKLYPPIEQFTGNVEVVYRKEY